MSELFQPELEEDVNIIHSSGESEFDLALAVPEVAGELAMIGGTNEDLEASDPLDRPVTLTADPIRDYLRAIGRWPLLSAEQEVDLSKRIETGLLAELLLSQRTRTLKNSEKIVPDDTDITEQELQFFISDGVRANRTMVESNLRLVVSIAKRYTGRGMSFLDLIQEGNGGLMHAVEKFDYKKGYKFSTYATWWVRQSITRAMADQARTIRIPVHMVEKTNKMSRLARDMTQQLGRKPTSAELAEELAESVETIEEWQAFNNLEPTSLDRPLGNGKPGPGETETSFGTLLTDDAPSVLDHALHGQLQADIKDMLSGLTDREAGVLIGRYGLNGQAPKTLQAVAEEFGVTRERIRQIEANVLKRLRASDWLHGLRNYLLDD